MKLGCEARDHFRCLELPIGVKDEEIARPVEDNASARPRFVFVRPYDGAQGRIDSPGAAPVLPRFVVAPAVGETIALRLGLIQRKSESRQNQSFTDETTNECVGLERRTPGNPTRVNTRIASNLSIYLFDIFGL